MSLSPAAVHGVHPFVSVVIRPAAPRKDIPVGSPGPLVGGLAT